MRRTLVVDLDHRLLRYGSRGVVALGLPAPIFESMQHEAFETEVVSEKKLYNMAKAKQTFKRNRGSMNKEQAAAFDAIATALTKSYTAPGHG